MAGPAVKQFAIGSDQYQVAKMTALTASYIYGLFVSSMIKLVRETPAEADSVSSEEPKPDTEAEAAQRVGFLWSMLSGSIDEKTYSSLQQKCLAVCSKQVQAGDSFVYSPVLMQNGSGRFAIPELAQDAVAVNRLIVEALQFNIAPFFTGGGSAGQPGLAPASPAPTR